MSNKPSLDDFIPEYKRYGINPIPWENKNKKNQNIYDNKDISTIVETQNLQLPNISEKTAKSWKQEFEKTDFSNIDESAYIPDYLNLTEDSKTNIQNVESDSQNLTDEYLLLINGELFKSGSKDYIENTVRNLIYGKNNQNQKIDPESILVYKKINVKIGIFLDQ